MNIRRIGTALLLIIFLCPAAGSAFDRGESTISKNWGKSFQAQKNAQIANPDAGIVTGPVTGLEGKAAQRTMEAYHESFSQEQARPGYTFDTLGIMVGDSN